MSSEIPWNRVAQFGAFVAVNAAAVALIGVGLNALAPVFDYNVAKIREMVALEGEEYPVVVLGNSVTLQSFDPGVIDPLVGTSSYNLATGGQSFVSSEIVLDHYLESNAAPELIVIGIFINRRSDEARISAELWQHLNADEAALYRTRYLEYEEDYLPWSFTVFNAVPAFRYRKTIDNVIKYWIAGESRIGWRRRGYLGTKYHPPAPMVVTERLEANFDIEGLRRVCQAATAAGARVLLYEPPNHPGLSERTEGRDDVLMAVEKLVESEPNVLEFRSFNDEYSLDYGFDEWGGLHHLNEYGAQRFGTEQLSPWLAPYVSSAP